MDRPDWLTRSRLALLAILIIAIVLVDTLFLLLGTLPALAALAGLVLGALPWIYDKSRERLSERYRIGRAWAALTQLGHTIAERLPAFTIQPGVQPDSVGWNPEQVAESILQNQQGTALDVSLLLQDLADSAISDICDQSIVERFGPDAFRCLVIHLSAESLARPFQAPAKSIVRSFVGETIQFLNSGPTLAAAGEIFAKSVVYLRENGRISDINGFWEFLDKPLDVEKRDKLTLEFSDPQLSFLVYELGKANDLLLLVRQRMSGRRLVKQISAGLRGDRGTRGRRFNSFLILKQEMKGGDRYIKSRIDSVPSRLVSAGTLYHDKGSAKYQSVNVLTLPNQYPDGKALLQKQFPGLSNLSADESGRAALAAIPLATDQAFYFPADVSTLRPPQQEFYRNWTVLLGKDRETFQEILSDFELNFLDVIQYLTLDFLVKNVVPGEKEYLRERTDRTLSVLGAKALLDLARTPPPSLARALKDSGYPHYDIADLTSFIESYTVPLREFLDERLLELSQEAIRNAQQILAIREGR
jgi:hypothetical protein